MEELGSIIMTDAVDLARKIGAVGVLAYWEQIGSFEGLPEAAQKTDLVLVLRGETGRSQAAKISDKVVLVPKAMLTRKAQIVLGVLAASSQSLFKPDDLVVCLAGPCGRAQVDAIQIVRIRNTGPAVSTDYTGPSEGTIAAHVFNGVLNLAVELAQEGREGRPIGTIFVLGDHERVLQFSSQAVLNPFAGYPEDDLSVLDQAMKETVREFSSLDGAFVIRGDGVLLAAGRHIQATSADLELPQGMGARHHAAAGITAVTEAVAMAISESSGSVTVFHKGKIIASLEKASPGLPLVSES